jgi:hypothetical protein
VADRDISAQAGEGRLVEDLCHEAEILVHHHTRAVADGHAGRLLAAMLQCV